MASAKNMEVTEDEGNMKAAPLPASTAAMVPVSKPTKSRRKISMPWFRQSSFGMTIAKLRLSRQHTIAAPEQTVEMDADEVSQPHRKVYILFLKQE